MEYTEIFEESLLKNLGEFVEFCVYDLKVNNYYDLIDKIIISNNISANIKQKDNKLYKKIKKEVLEEIEE